MVSKHSSMPMFICMPINKCAPRLKLQYPVQIQQSEVHSPCTSHQCLAPLQTVLCLLKTTHSLQRLTKMGRNPSHIRRSEGGDGEQLRRRDVLMIVKLNVHNLKMLRLYFMPQNPHDSTHSALCKHPVGHRILFSLLFISNTLFLFLFPHLCHAASFRVLHFLLVKAVQSNCEYSNPLIRKKELCPYALWVTLLSIVD